MKDEMASCQSSPVKKLNTKEYTLGFIIKYFQYIIDLEEDGYPLNCFTPDEFEEMNNE